MWRRVANRWHSVLERTHTSSRNRKLRRVAQLLDRNLTIVDVGCRAGIAQAWEGLGRHATVIGFDADASECERLLAAYRGECDVRFIAAALGARQGTATLHVTVDPTCSSLLPPDPILAETVPQLSCLRVRETSAISTTTLDACAATAGVGPVDFVKIDTQGSELQVLEGASAALESARALEVEVEFNPLYVGQPLFGDVDAFLRARGFVVWRLQHMTHYSLRGTQPWAAAGIRDRQFFDSRPLRIRGGEGQLYWCNAYYVRKEVAAVAENADWQSSLRDCCLFTALGFHDLARFAFTQAVATSPRALRSQLSAWSAPSFPFA